jgi:hypothetical protein
MDEERLSLLGEDVVGEEDKECFTTGMAFLQTASQSSSLAGRYVTLLQHLNEEDDQEGNINASQHSELRNTETTQPLGHLQSSVYPWTIESLDLTMEANLDFANFDDWLWETGSFGDPTESTVPSM